MESYYITAGDGTKLAVTVILPVESTGPWPVVFVYFPYKRVVIDPQSGNIMVSFVPDNLLNCLIKNGYAFVIADMRGSGASFGSRVDMTPQLGLDGKEIIDWIASQSWCDGNVGMMGGSYLGWAQFAIAGQKPAALKCIMPEAIAFDLYSDAWFPGGIPNVKAHEFIKELYTIFDTNAYLPDMQIWPTLPVVDEDGDGELLDEIPLDVNKTGNFLDDGYPPTYLDGEPRQHIYYHATVEHLKNVIMADWALSVTYRDDIVAQTATMAEMLPNDWPARIAESSIAIYNIGSWFDIFTRGPFLWYATLNKTNPSKLLIYPSFHSSPDMSPLNIGPYWEYFGEQITEAVEWLIKERLRFFDRYLKGIKNGIDTEQPVRIFVMNGEGWRYENEWPLARQVNKIFYFDEGNSLNVEPPKSCGSDNYVPDFTYSSYYGLKGNGTRWIPRHSPETVMKRTLQDHKCLTYSSPPLAKGMEITGHPIITLWVSSTAENGDFFVYLEDVDNEGEAYYITEGMLRAGFANLKENKDILLSGEKIDVLPKLPWHGFKINDYVNNIFRNDNIVKLVFDLLPTSWLIKKGHCIRVSIACSDWPLFKLHPQLSPNNNPNDPSNVIPTVTIYRETNYLSNIQLPIIP